MNGQQMLVIVPTYNEAQSVPRLISYVLELLPAIHILVVDDGSPDGTADICQSIADGDSLGRVHVMRRAGKQGLGSAYIAGFGWGAGAGCGRNGASGVAAGDPPRPGRAQRAGWRGRAAHRQAERRGAVAAAECSAVLPAQHERESAGQVAERGEHCGQPVLACE